MNRVLEKVFPTFDKNGSRPKTYYSYPEGSPSASVTFRVDYGGTETLPTGRLVLFFAPKSDPEPRLDAFDLDALKPIFAQDVLQVLPGETTDFDSAMFSMPEALAFVPNDLSAFSDELYVQALFSENLNDPDANSCLGNHYSKPVRVTLEHLEGERIVNIVADQVITETMDLTSDEWIQHVAMKSELLSEFHGKDVFMFASVVLPLDYASRSADAVFPTIYYIEGFTGTETFADRARAFLSSEMGDVWKSEDWEVPMFRVTLGSRFKYGHTSFADSDCNGPWGTALVTEFIPYLESQFPMVKNSTGRFLHGHSSGGWSALWLQIQNPEFFGGAWSSAPDPVDFSAFQIVNIYESKNMFWDPYGRPYPTSREGGEVTCTIRNENLVERVFANGNGGQWDAFFAVFGPRDYITGLPVPLFDKSTGVINRDVVEYWSRFDIVKVLREGGQELLDKLQDKIHVVCGSEDTYYLEGACYKLQEFFGPKSKPQNAYQPVTESYVDIVPGDHTTIRNRGYYQVAFEEIMIAYMRNQDD